MPADLDAVLPNVADGKVADDTSDFGNPGRSSPQS